MIDKRELRIGNWVLLKSKLNQMVPYDFVYWADKDFEPVELTPDILVKGGLKFDVDGFFHLIDDDILINNDPFHCYIQQNDNGLIPFGNTLHFVHQLQNLYFALTGQELTINLK